MTKTEKNRWHSCAHTPRRRWYLSGTAERTYRRELAAARDRVSVLVETYARRGR